MCLTVCRRVRQNRSIAEDLLSMICADGLVTAKSTLTHLVGRHSLATRKYFTGACTENLGRETTKQGVKVRLEAALILMGNVMNCVQSEPV